MGRTHGENSISKLDHDAKRVANIYMELLERVKVSKIHISMLTSVHVYFVI